jgi:2-polyprenyl-3-methyl-5-hydroxy-6-metoxy-1,4-benzoquinol methylase/predicted O-methyltransferase YrrM
MLEEILKNYSKTSFDFRKYVCEEDDLSYLFEEWIDYYRMKYAIVKALQPKSILEIGVRYGYSAITFLEASGNGTYLGIDNDSDTFGGKKGAIDWAKKITEDFDAKFLLANTQSMTSFPGEFYDFIHIDGQQDGDGTFHDMELALEKGRWILVDGYFWSSENLLSATYFLNKYKDFIELALIIPSYAGELLIKVKDSVKCIFTKHIDKNYLSTKDAYDYYYSLSDCKDYDLFRKSRDRKFEDPRIIAICCLADPHKDMEILELDCGGGELSYALSQSGAQVTGIDYSSFAINIAKSTYLNSPVDNLKFIQGNFLDYEFNKKFDRIIAADFIEHIEEDKLEIMIRKIRDILKEDGLFIVHIYPNKLYYQHSYEEKRQIAKSLDIYVPQNPRTYYEDLMHINEQTPQSISLLLEKHFPHVVTWVNNYPDFLGSLIRPFSLEECSNSKTILAIGSFKTIDKNSIIQLLNPIKLDRDGIDIILSSDKKTLTVLSNEKLELDINIKNNGKERIISMPTFPVHISYHWLRANGDYEVFGGLRTQIMPALNPQEQRVFQVKVVSPKEEGEYKLQIDLVQEGCFWFDEVTNNSSLNINVRVERNPDEYRSEGSKMDTFEIKDDEINVEEIMEKIRENIKKRKESGVYDNRITEEIEQVFSDVSCSKEIKSQEVGITDSNFDIRNSNYSISSHRPMLGKFLVKGRNLVHGEVRRYVDPVFQRQSELNYNLAGLLSDSKKEVNSFSNEMKQLKTEIEDLVYENKALKHQVEQLDNETERLKIESERFKVESEQLKPEIISILKKEVESVISDINLDLENKAWLSRILESNIQRKYKNNAIKTSETANSEINYYIFEERFRGSRENILQHQRNFINYFENCTDVLDIGCGRGEFLELAKKKGIKARGIDIEEDMISFCKSRGLDVELKDAIEALEEIDDKSLDGIFISQVVEHLSPDYLLNVLNLCYKKMKYGFYVIIETVNPLSLFSLANFYIDLSHMKPVHPETLRFLLNTVGFRDIETKFLSPVPSEMKLQKLPDLDNLTEKLKLMIGIYNQNIDMINNALYGAQDYAVIGKK